MSEPRAGFADASTGSAPDEPRENAAPANFALLYESRDGKLCLFQDADGHLTAVRAAKLV